MTWSKRAGVHLPARRSYIASLTTQEMTMTVLRTITWPLGMSKATIKAVSGTSSDRTETLLPPPPPVYRYCA